MNLSRRGGKWTIPPHLLISLENVKEEEARVVSRALHVAIACSLIRPPAAKYSKSSRGYLALSRARIMNPSEYLNGPKSSKSTIEDEYEARSM